MAGMEQLGRNVNVIPIASGKPFKFRGASVVSFLCTGTDTFTVRIGSSFAVNATAPGPVIRTVYWSTASDGTVGWSKLILAAAADNIVTGTTAGLTTATVAWFSIYTSELADPNNYIKCTATAAGLVIAILGDLTHQRGPANLELLGA